MDNSILFQSGHKNWMTSEAFNTFILPLSPLNPHHQHICQDLPKNTKSQTPGSSRHVLKHTWPSKAEERQTPFPGEACADWTLAEGGWLVFDNELVLNPLECGPGRYQDPFRESLGSKWFPNNAKPVICLFSSHSLMCQVQRLQAIRWHHPMVEEGILDTSGWNVCFNS